MSLRYIPPEGLEQYFADFSFKEVEQLLAGALWVVDDPKKRATFRSRMQQLQKLGLPWGANAGRGVRVRYSLPQVAEMLLYFDLLDIGVMPNVLTIQFRDNPVYKRLGFYSQVIKDSVLTNTPFWFYFSARALTYLRVSNPDAAENSYDGNRLFDIADQPNFDERTLPLKSQPGSQRRAAKRIPSFDERMLSLKSGVIVIDLADRLTTLLILAGILPTPPEWNDT